MCGHPLVTKRPLDDVQWLQLMRGVRFFVHYVNPTPVVGTLPVFGGRVLLCRRAHLNLVKMDTASRLVNPRDTAAREPWEGLGRDGAHARAGMLWLMFPTYKFTFLLSELDALPLAPGSETMEQPFRNWNSLGRYQFATVKTLLNDISANRPKGSFAFTCSGRVVYKIFFYPFLYIWKAICALIRF